MVDLNLTGGGVGSDGVGALEQALAHAALLGAELDPKFRVLAVTLEPELDRYAFVSQGAVVPDDRRVQLLCHPVSTIIAALRRHAGRELMEFTDEQLPTVVGALDGLKIGERLFGLPEPRPGSWGPRFSMEGRSSAPNGVANTLTIQVSDDELSFDLFARFDEIELRGPDGQPLPIL